jgi:hypothetical protein
MRARIEAATVRPRRSKPRAGLARHALPPIMISAVALLPWTIKQKLRPRNLLLPNSPKTHETLLKHD